MIDASLGKERRTLLSGLLGVLCGVAFLKSWVLGFGFLFALAGSAVLMCRPRHSWIFVLFASFAVSNSTPQPIGSILFWGLAAIFLAGYWLKLGSRSRVEWFPGPLWGCVLGWFSWALVSAAGSLDLTMSFKEIGRYLISFGFLLTYLNWLRTREQIQWAVRWWERISIGMAAGLCGMAFLMRLSPEGSPLNLIGPSLRSYAALGFCFAAIIPLSVSLNLASDRPRRFQKGVGLVLLCAVLIWTRSRAACLAAIMGTLFLFWQTSRRAFRWMLVAVLVGGAAGVLFLSWNYDSIGSGLIENLSGRPLVWKAALSAIGESPLLGMGPGCWKAWFPKHFVGADFLLYDRMGNWFVLPPSRLGGEAHNLFLTSAAEMGLPSVMWLVAMLFVWFCAAGRSLRSVPPGEFRALAVGSVASMFGLIFLCLFENGPIIGRARGGEVVVVWLVAALPLVIGRLAPADILEHE